MANIIEIVKQHAENGDKVKVDFKEQTISINGKKMDLSKNLGIRKYEDLNQWLDVVEQLYDNYKYSRPTTETMKKRNCRFKALSMEELINQCGRSALSNPVNRDVALAELEAFIVLSIKNGSFNVDKLFKDDWFFQGADKTLIMLKNWFV